MPLCDWPELFGCHLYCCPTREVPFSLSLTTTKNTFQTQLMCVCLINCQDELLKMIFTIIQCYIQLFWYTQYYNTFVHLIEAEEKKIITTVRVYTFWTI